jgi:hypothetical protein
MSIHSRAAAIVLAIAGVFTASAPAKDLDAPTLLVKHRFNLNVLNNSIQIYHDYLLLLPDGTAYENTPKEGMKDVTAAKLAGEAKERPRDLGKWKRIAGPANGDGIETTFIRSIFDDKVQAARDKVEVETFQKTDQGGWSKDGKHASRTSGSRTIPCRRASMSASSATAMPSYSSCSGRTRTPWAT